MLHHKPYVKSVETVDEGQPSFVLLFRFILDKQLYFYYLDVNEKLDARAYEVDLVLPNKSKKFVLDMPPLGVGTYEGKPLNVL